MRRVLIPLLVLATGCATSPRAKTAAERLKEILRERQQREQARAAEQAGAEATGSAQEVPVAEAQPVAPEVSAAPETPVAPQAPVAPATHGAGGAGARAGLFGLRASVLGSGLATGTTAGSASTLGVRYFFTDSAAVNAQLGFALAITNEQTRTGLGLGLGLNLYAGASESPLRPYFGLQFTLDQVGGDGQGQSVVGLAAGGGLEYWLVPQVSLSAGLMMGLSTETDDGTFVIGTFQPGLGVTLYAL